MKDLLLVTVLCLWFVANLSNTFPVFLKIPFKHPGQFQGSINLTMIHLQQVPVAAVNN